MHKFLCFVFLFVMGSYGDSFFSDLQVILDANNEGLFEEGEKLNCDYDLFGHIVIDCDNLFNEDGTPIVPDPRTAEERCTSITIMDLSVPSLPTTIDEIANKLSSLEFIGCSLETIPAEISALTDLEYLNLAGNAIEDYDFLDDVSLTFLKLASNGLAAIPTQVANVLSLRELDLSANPITSISSLSTLVDLYKLNVADTSLNFDLSTGVNDFPTLYDLTIDETLISGAKPDKITSLTCFNTCVSSSECTMNAECSCSVFLKDSCEDLCEWKGQKCEVRTGGFASLKLSFLLLIGSLIVFVF